jgi:hypothetical protein
MIRTYSILSSNGELQSSPYIRNLERTYDLVLTVNQPKIVNFLFQIPITRAEAHEVYAMFDEDTMAVGNIYVDCFSNQTLISTTITPKDIGSLKISFVVPDHLALAGVKADHEAPHYGY